MFLLGPILMFFLYHYAREELPLGPGMIYANKYRSYLGKGSKPKEIFTVLMITNVEGLKENTNAHLTLTSS